MRLMKTLLLGVLMPLVPGPTVQAQSAGVWAAAWPHTRGQLIVDMPYADLEVVGHDKDSVLVSVRAANDESALLPGPRIVGTELRLVAAQNQVPVVVTIYVPYRFDVVLRTSNYRPIYLRGIHGAVAVENSNAGIHMTGLRGAVIAAASNGPITAEFEEFPAEGPLSFITGNDSISVTFPPASEMDLFLETDNGIVVSDFTLVSIPGTRGIPRGSGPTSRLRSRVGAGGLLVRARTDNGTIAIRRHGGG